MISDHPIAHHRSRLDPTYNDSTRNRGRLIWDKRPRSKHWGPVRIRPVINQWPRFHDEAVHIPSSWIRDLRLETHVTSNSSDSRSMAKSYRHEEVWSCANQGHPSWDRRPANLLPYPMPRRNGRWPTAVAALLEHRHWHSSARPKKPMVLNQAGVMVSMAEVPHRQNRWRQGRPTVLRCFASMCGIGEFSLDPWLPPPIEETIPTRGALQRSF
jgi:hypothetical protein